MRKFLFNISVSLCFMLVFGNLSQGQSVSTTRLRWAANEFYNKEVKETITHASTFETTPQRIKWIQKNGARVYEFEITGIIGSWPDSSKEGELTYQVSFKGNSGTVKFSRKEGKVAIETDIPVAGKNILPYTFFVNLISSL